MVKIRNMRYLTSIENQINSPYEIVVHFQSIIVLQRILVFLHIVEHCDCTPNVYETGCHTEDRHQRAANIQSKEAAACLNSGDVAVKWQPQDDHRLISDVTEIKTLYILNIFDNPFATLNETRSLTALFLCINIQMRTNRRNNWALRVYFKHNRHRRRCEKQSEEKEADLRKSSLSLGP